MYISETTDRTAQQWRAANQDLYALLYGATIQFSGTSATGDGFTGTGVVVRVTQQYATVVTAKHNLFIAGRGEADPVRYYREHIRARIVSGAGQVQSNIAAIEVFGATPTENRGLDLMEVRVTDRKFVAAAQALIAPGVAWARYLRPAEEVQQGWIIRPASLTAAKTLLMNGVHEGKTLANADGYTLVHMGYGLVQGQRSGYAFRTMPVATIGAPTLIDRTHDDWADIFTYTASPTETGKPGDSGGPIFGVSRPITPKATEANPNPQPQTSVALVGVHSGENFFRLLADDQRAGEVTQNNAMTLATREQLG